MTSTRDQDVDQVAGLRDDVERALREVGAESALRYLPTEAAAPAERAKVVVIGEIGSGKTSLINSLVRRPGMLPTTSTNTYAAVGLGTAEGLRVHLRGGTVVSHDVSEAGEALGPAVGGDVTHAEILLDEPILADLTLFDTPGAGGMNSTDTSATLAALDYATAVIFVSSAEAKISIAERNFLADAAQRIQHVVFVMTKVDLLDDLGEANLEEFRTTVREDASRFPQERFANLSFFPFSAVLADEGLRGDADSLADSGLAALWAELDRVTAQAGRFSQLNALRSIKSTISEAYRLLEQRRGALVDPATAESLAAREAQIRECATGWRTDVMLQIRDAREKVRKDLRRRIKALRDDYNVRLTDSRHVDVEATEAQMKQDLDALHIQTITEVRDHVVDIAGRVIATIPGADAPVEANEVDARLTPPDESPSDYLSERQAPVKDPLEMRKNIQEIYIFGNMFKSGKAVFDSFGDKVAQDGTGGSLTGLLFGLGLHAWGARRRKQFNDVNSLRAGFGGWVAETNGELRQEIQEGFERGLYAIQEVVESKLRVASDVLAEEKRALTFDVKEKRAEERRIESLKERIVPLAQRWRSQHDALMASTTRPSAALSDR